MQRQCMHATGHLQLLRKHLINSLMPFNLHLPRKGRRHHGHLEVRLRIRRHAVLVTLVLHLKNAGVERLIQLGFNCILHFHYFLTPQFALYVVAISLSLKRLWASASQKCVLPGMATPSPHGWVHGVFWEADARSRHLQSKQSTTEQAAPEP